MSDISRKEAIEILKYQYNYGQMEQSVHDALGLAISSLETDEAYQLEYERTTKNDLGVDAEDCISRKAVFKIMDDIETAIHDGEGFDYSGWCRKVYDLSPVTPQEPRWIPVSKRLPEELLGVLVYCPTYDNIYCAYLEKGEWKIFSKQADEKINEVVVAWQSLPEHYKMVEPQEREDKE